MKAKYEKLIQEVIKSLNWSRIKHFHQVFGIRWQFEEKDGGFIERFPTVSELKDELKTLIKFAISKEMPEVDYGNWYVRWTPDTELNPARLEAIFSLEEALAIENMPEETSLIILKANLDKALSIEDYEQAAKIRDKIASLKEKNCEESR